MSTHSDRAHSDLASFSRPVWLREVPQTLRVADGPITVVIAEDSYLIRESLVHMLGGHDRVEIVAVCSDPAALEFAIAWERPRVVLTETRMLGSAPSEAIAGRPASADQSVRRGSGAGAGCRCGVRRAAA
jgi:hypothetical protein